MCSSAHVDNGKKDILIIGVGPKQGSDNTTLTAEKEYIKNFSEKQKEVCLCLHYNGINSYLFVINIKIDKFKAKDC